MNQGIRRKGVNTKELKFASPAVGITQVSLLSNNYGHKVANKYGHIDGSGKS